VHGYCTSPLHALCVGVLMQTLARVVLPRIVSSVGTNSCRLLELSDGGMAHTKRICNGGASSASLYRRWH
jgi:hypothetical protein